MTRLLLAALLALLLGMGIPTPVIPPPVHRTIWVALVRNGPAGFELVATPRLMRTTLDNAR